MMRKLSCLKQCGWRAWINNLSQSCTLFYLSRERLWLIIAGMVLYKREQVCFKCTAEFAYSWWFHHPTPFTVDLGQGMWWIIRQGRGQLNLRYLENSCDSHAKISLSNEQPDDRLMLYQYIPKQFSSLFSSNAWNDEWEAFIETVIAQSQSLYQCHNQLCFLSVQPHVVALYYW